MKKLFKLFALAFIASSLTLVSCTKEELEDAINTLKVQVTFDGTSYTMTYNKGIFLKEGNWIAGYDRTIRLITAVKGKTDGEYVVFDNPYLDLRAGMVDGAYKVNTDESEFYFDKDKVNALTAHKNDGYTYNDWSIYEVMENGTISFDASSLNFNCDLTMNMFNEYDFELNWEGDVMDEFVEQNPSTALKRLTLKVYNMTFEKEQ